MAIAMRRTGLALGLAVLLAHPARGADQEAVNKAVEGGVAFLKRLQQPSGEWTYGTYAGATALTAMTLLECDVDKDDPAIRKSADYLRQASPNLSHTYSISLIIMFLDRLGEEQDKPLLESLTKRLLNGQNANGGWTYNCPLDAEEVRRLTSKLKDARDKKPQDPEQQGGAGKLPPNIPPPGGPFNPPGVDAVNAGFRLTGDNSNTQFATLALWVARRQKFSLPVDKALALVEARFRASQNADGGWSYTPAEGRASARSTASMTGAGLLGLAVGYGVASETALRTDLKATVRRRRDKVDAPRDPNRDPNVRAGLLALGWMIKGPFATGQSNFWPAARANPPIGQQQQALAVPESTRIDYYALWSIERVAMAYGLKTFDKQDWYSWGAQIILPNQKPGGQWDDGSYSGHSALTDTCFALLFLRRSNLANDLTDKLKGKVRDPGEVKLTSGGVGGESLKQREQAGIDLKNNPKGGDKPKTGSLPELVPPGERPSGNDTQGDSEVTRLRKELVQSSPERQAVLLDKLRESRGVVYTQALAEAIPQLTGATKTKARDALAERLARMTAATLRDKLGDEDLEIRRAAALASAVKGDKSFVPDLIKLLDDAEPPVARAAHAALKVLTGKDFGPEDDASRAERKKAAADWKSWWNKQGGASARAPEGDDSTAQDDKEKLQGTWIAVRLEGETREAAKTLLEKVGIQLAIRGDKFTLSVQKRVTSRGTFTIDPAKEPKEIDLISGTNVAKGIYSWEDDQLKLCISPVNQDRAKVFLSKPQANQYVYILKRQKP